MARGLKERDAELCDLYPPLLALQSTECPQLKETRIQAPNIYEVLHAKARTGSCSCVKASRCAVSLISSVTTLQAERHSKSGASHKAVMFSRLRRGGHEVIAAVLKVVGRDGSSLVVVDYGVGFGVGNLVVSVGNLDWEIEVFEGILEDGDCFVAVLEGNYYYYIIVILNDCI